MKDVAQQKDADRETIDGPHNEDALEITITAAEHRVPVELYNHIAWMFTDIDYTKTANAKTCWPCGAYLETDTKS